MAIFDTTPAALLIRDVKGDTGAEPDLAATSFDLGVPFNYVWESLDIGAVSKTPLANATGGAVTNSSGPGPDLTSDDEI